jgi:chromosome condensin MukBEF ATPase and DNA-binding subunit MukB
MFSFVAEGWVRLDLSRIAGRELARDQKHLTISGLEPAAHSTTGFLDLVTENSRKVRTQNRIKIAYLT